MKTNLLSLILLAFHSLFMNSCTQGKTDAYNVLFIAVDDLNDYVSLLHDYPGIKTPNLDALAKSAVTFKNAYCAGPICNPSRTSLLTGLAPYITGVYSNDDHWSISKQASDALVLPEAFKKAGYTTLWAGKIFHDMSAPSTARLEAMWDDLGGNLSRQLYDGSTNVCPYGPGHPNGYGILPDSVFADIHNTELAQNWLNKDYDKPFFMAIGIIRPHAPMTAPWRFFDMYPLESISLPPGYLENDLDDVPEMGKKLSGMNLNRLKKSGKWPEYIQAYLACVSFADESIGRVITALENSKYRDNTIVVLWGDHGYHVGEKEHLAKTTLWEQGTHNLLMFSVPGMISKGVNCNEAVSLLDIYPTLQELCNLPDVPQKLSGQSIANLIRNPDLERKDPVLTTYPYRNHAVRDEQWRYIHYDDGGEELYDHDTDPNEWVNLASKIEYHSEIERLSRFIPVDNAKPVGLSEAYFKWVKEGRKNLPKISPFATAPKLNPD